MTAVQEEACNLLSALATAHGWQQSAGTIWGVDGKWLHASRMLAYRACTAVNEVDAIDAIFYSPWEFYAEAEALIRDGSIR